VVLCNARDFDALPSLPIPVAATLAFADEGNADLPALPAGRRMVWSGHYPRLGSSVTADYLGLREVADAPPPSAQSGVFVILNPEWIKVRRGIGDAVISLRKAYSAAFVAQSQAMAAPESATTGARVKAWLRAWVSAIKALNVRFRVTDFFKNRIAELRGIFPSAHRGRLTVWK
ncbi:MAG: hypothetical protein ACREKL_03970, partial [Chthoniobacterales bacterium]